MLLEPLRGSPFLKLYPNASLDLSAPGLRVKLQPVGQARRWQDLELLHHVGDARLPLEEYHNRFNLHSLVLHHLHLCWYCMGLEGDGDSCCYEVMISYFSIILCPIHCSVKLSIKSCFSRWIIYLEEGEAAPDALPCPEAESEVGAGVPLLLVLLAEVLGVERGRVREVPVVNLASEYPGSECLGGLNQGS